MLVVYGAGEVGKPNPVKNFIVVRLLALVVEIPVWQAEGASKEGVAQLNLVSNEEMSQRRVQYHMIADSRLSHFHRGFPARRDGRLHHHMNCGAESLVDNEAQFGIHWQRACLC